MKNVQRDTQEQLAKQVRKFINIFSCSSEMNIFSNWIHFYINQMKNLKIFHDSVEEWNSTFH